MAEDKLAGTGIRVVACPANDDMFEIDDLLAGARVVETGDEDHPIRLGDFTMVSMGWTNPTPWHTFREAEEPELAERIDRALSATDDPETTIFNFHAPPYGSQLDNAPALNEDLSYVSGGQAIRPSDPRRCTTRSNGSNRCSRSTVTSTRARGPRGSGRRSR